MQAKRTVLVTGGAGYIGRGTAEHLRLAGYNPILIDNFSTGRRGAVGDLTLKEIDLTERDTLFSLLEGIGPVHAIFHFAAKALVSESCERPSDYFRNNLLATTNIGEWAAKTKVRYLVNSSSCTVYGHAKSPIGENAPFEAISPYGFTKIASEELLNQYSRLNELKVVHLRYFNPAGSYRRKYGELHQPETHLVPSVISALSAGRQIPIFGSDYETPDGTCIRDFLHIEDLAEAHVQTLKRLEQNSTFAPAINLGAGKGTSVKEVIACAEQVLKKKALIELRPRRTGDPAKLVADVTLAKVALGWEAKKSLQEIILDHHEWIKEQQ